MNEIDYDYFYLEDFGDRLELIALNIDGTKSWCLTPSEGYRTRREAIHDLIECWKDRGCQIEGDDVYLENEWFAEIDIRDARALLNSKAGR